MKKGLPLFGTKNRSINPSLMNKFVCFEGDRALFGNRKRIGQVYMHGCNRNPRLMVELTDIDCGVSVISCAKREDGIQLNVYIILYIMMF